MSSITHTDQLSMITKLKEEIEALKTSLQTTTSYHTDKYELLEDENKRLRKENEKLKERDWRMCEIANANGWDIYPTDSEEEE